MKRLILISLVLFSCKKEPEIKPSTTTSTYTPTTTQYTIDIEYRVKTKLTSYVLTYNKPTGFNSDGSPIILSITDTIENGGNDTVKFSCTTSPFGIKYHYQLFLLAQNADSNVVSISINNIQKVYRPNYNMVYNFVQYDY